jgi:integral membrane protein (TIGR01906 family)
MTKRIIDVSLSVIFSIAVAILTITFSIGLPIYVRAFYYSHIPSIQEEFKTELDITIEEDFIREAYDEVLDFLVLDGREFGTGQLPFSNEGKGHFEDCKVLFDLNRNALIISVVLIVCLLVLNRFGVIDLKKPRGFDLTFFSGVGTLTLFALLGLIVSMDFSAAFTVFHKIFFPGKDNWLFDPLTDPIILFMPQRFFMHCAILICASILVLSLALIVIGVIRKKSERR